MTGRALVAQADALHLPLPDASVDLVVTSPPFYSLRQYEAGPAQLGSEPTPHAYLDALWAATAEMARVLKPSGSILVDLGDKYAERGGPERDAFADGGQVVYRAARPRRKGERETGIRQKSLMLLPERYRIGCVDRLGLIARAVICWDKPNGLPESVTDRVRRSHEDWVHLTKEPHYYSALDEIRVPHSPGTHPGRLRAVGNESGNGVTHRTFAGDTDSFNPLGALPGSVWRIPSEPLRLPEWLGVSHYAAFPSEWPRRLVLAYSPPGICLACDQGRWPVVDKRQETYYGAGRFRSGAQQVKDGAAEVGWKYDEKWRTEATILGYACACTPFTDHPGAGVRAGVGQIGRADNPGRYPNTGEGWERSPSGKGGLGDRPKVGPWREYHLTGWQAPPTRPAVVLDCFGGVGTTSMVARALGRVGLSFDLSFPYSQAARWRVTSDHAAKAISRTNLERQRGLLF